MEERKDPPRLPQTITISTGTIFRAILILIIIAFLYLIRGVLAMFLAALFLAALIDPFADWLESKKIPRGLAALIVYVIGLSLVVGALILIVPPVMEELQHFLTAFSPNLGAGLDYSSIFSWEILSENIQQILATARGSGLSAAVPEVLELGSTALGVVAAVLIVLVLAFFLVAEKNSLMRAVAFITPAEYQPFVMQMSGKIRESLGAWLRGQLLLMLIVGLLTYLTLLIVGVKYALLLGLMAGLFEIVPYIGPWLSAVPGVILALAVSPVHAVITALAYLVIQAIENNLLVPKIMQRAVGLNPIISLLAVLVGWRIGGVVGVFLSIPTAMAIAVVLSEIFKTRSTTT